MPMSEATVPATATGPTAQRLLWAAILASFVAFLDGSIVNIALPAIDRDLHGGVVLQQWVLDGYLLTLSALILVAGAVSDRFGRLRVLRIAVVAFTVTSLLCAISPTGVVLVVARLLQGVAGALLVPGSLALIIATFEGDAQGRAIGRWTAWTSVSFLVGPLVGGLLVDAVGWRSVFALSVLPALGALLLLGRARDEARTVAAARFDVVSAVLAALGLAGVVTGLIQLGAERSTLPPWAGTALLVVGAVLLVVFVVVDRRTASPLVPPALFRSGNFAAGNAATLFIYAGLNLLGFVPALFLQQVVRLPATAAALVGLPSTILMILLSGRFGALAGRFGPRLFMTVGPLVAATGAVVMSFVRSPEGAVPLLVAGVVLAGLGIAATVAPLTAAVLGAVPASESGIGSAVNNAVARVAGLVATACVGFVLGGVVAVPGFVRASFVTAALLAAGGLVSLAGIRNPRRGAGQDGTAAG